MITLDLIYVTSGKHPELEKLICETTRSQYAHAALGLMIEGEYFTLEATLEGVKLKQGDIYADYPIKQVIKLPITEEQRKAVALKALTVAGMKYGRDDCLISAINDRWGLKAAEFAAKIIDNPHTIQCSGIQVEAVRVAFPDFAGNDPAEFYTPEHSRKHGIEYAGIVGGIIEGGEAA